ncbi:hypothetical protein [Paenibacillus eucommiae]|uniref:Uncharacterized protein n=1 Tax=Paenibacillus eucommiae TaxID=1355755 RepID=A0ABS4INY0_9BACL|nr:hypothetical protein [Paenibacillus eucommiae]MBP1989268.1 hypothetical protein [Paenibacillus eucommiae]
MYKADEQADWLQTIVKPLITYLPALNPADVWDPAMDNRIEALALPFIQMVDSIEPGTKTGAALGAKEKENAGLAFKAGLFLCNESLDKSHSISQEITSRTGSYLHGLMHRMEGDFSNAKYWFSDGGQHPISTQLVTCLRNYLSLQDLTEVNNDALRSKLEALVSYPAWNAAVFVDAVELQLMDVQHAKADEWLRHIQRFEIKLILDYCYEQGCGGRLIEAIEQQ